MALTQETFLGASIRNFSSTMGWGQQPSVLEVGLVEDPANGDSFNPPEVGRPVYFDYQDWQFGGILQNYSSVRGEAGNPLYQAQITDPRELLSGVQLILQDYHDTTYTSLTPNLYNIYGYLENTLGFGGSLENDSGIPWRLIRNAFWYMQLVSPIQFRGYTYMLLPFAAMDILPDYYRVGGGVVTALDFINNICDAIGHDYFADLWHSSFGATGGDIYIYTVDRRMPLGTGKIEEFVNSTDGAVTKEQGYELVNATVRKFCVGGKVATLWPQDTGILPYWGYDPIGNLIIGTGDFESIDGGDYQMTLNGLSLAIETGDTGLVYYRTDLAELRHALIGKDDWEAFLWSKNGVEGSIHKNKAERIGVTEQARTSILKDILNTKVRAPALVGVGKDIVDLADDERKQRNLDIIYEFVHMYATEYYGKQFMVPVPSVLGKIEPETYRIILSHHPIQAGYTDELSWAIMQRNGYMPFNPEKFTTQENKVVCYTRFAGITDFDEIEDETLVKSKYGIEHLNINDYILDSYANSKVEKIRENLFVRADVEENLVFSNKASLIGPRAVVKLSAQIVDNVESKTTMSEAGVELYRAYLSDFATSDEELADMLAQLERTHKGFGGDYFNFGKFARCYKPDLAVVPLQNNLLRYGPWVSDTRIDAYNDPVTGKVEFEIDDSLVPWEYGGYNAMNLAGNVKVFDAAAGQQISEYGSVQFPGVPTKQLGEVLLDSGPVITDVSVNVAEEGLTTTYRMNTWSFRFGGLINYNADKIKQISKLAQDQRKAFRKLFGYAKPTNITKEKLLDLKSKGSRRYSEHSSHPFIGGEVFIDGSGDDTTVKTNIALLPGYNLLTQINSSYYTDQAVMSLDGLFAPYTTNKDTSGSLPKFEEPTSSTTPTVDDLNPFGGDSTILASMDTVEIPKDLVSDGSNQSSATKGIGLKAPVVVAGWGYDTNGNPVPVSSGSATEFLDNYKQRADQWKVGPLDIRWDDERKVWTGGGTSNLTKPFVLTENLLAGESALAHPINIVYDGFGMNWTAESGTNYRLYDYLLSSGTQHFAGDRIIASFMDTCTGSGSIWIVTNGSCSCYE